MSQPPESALLRAVCENPDDDAPRLIFADYLDEHGDPDRAEFIRVQCRLEGLDEGDDEWFELDLRARELLREHREEWIRPVEPFLLWDEEGFHYRSRLLPDILRRGFPENLVAMRGVDFIAHHGDLFRAAPVRGAQFWEDSPDRDFGWLGCPALRRLRALEVQDLNVEDCSDMVRAVAGCPHLAGLSGLSLAGREASPEAMRALASSPHLRSLRVLRLSLSGTDSWLPGLARHLSMPQLCDLSIGPHVTPEVLAHLTAAPWLTRLRRLELSTYGRLAEASTVALLSSPRVRSLRGLALENYGLGPEGATALTASPHLGRLRELDLSNNPRLGTAGARALAGSANLDGVRKLNLHGCLIGPAGVKALLRSPRLSRLRWLDLSFNKVTDRCLEASAASPQRKPLRFLDLRANHEISDFGAAALATGPRWERLAGLSVSSRYITRKGIMALVEGPALDQLVSLKVFGRVEDGRLARALGASPAAARLRELELPPLELTEADVTALVRSPHLGGLRYLSFQVHNLSARGKQRLRERFGSRLHLI